MNGTVTKKKLERNYSTSKRNLTRLVLRQRRGYEVFSCSEAGSVLGV